MTTGGYTIVEAVTGHGMVTCCQSVDDGDCGAMALPLSGLIVFI
jgi:hypothetical protein